MTERNAQIAKTSQSPTQKMPQAFFVSGLGNRAIGQSGNHTPLLNNRVNYLTVYIQFDQFKHSHFSAIQAELYAFNAINLFQGENYVLFKMR
jgi:hypothetical protein